MRKILSAILAAILFLDAVSLITLSVLKEKSGPSAGSSAVFEDVKIAIAGSNIISSELLTQASQRKTGGYDFFAAYENIAPIISGCDLALFTHEGAVSSEHNPCGTALYNAPQELVESVAKCGFNAVSLATGHAADFGEKGLINTIGAFAGGGLQVTGAYASKDSRENLSTADVGGIKIAFISFTASTVGNALPQGSECSVITSNEDTYIQQMLSKSSKEADFTIVLANWGNDNSEDISEEISQKCQKLSSWGADVIVGTGGGIRKSEYIARAGKNETLVVYSLGNLISSPTSVDEALGGILTFTVSKNSQTGETALSNENIEGVVTHFGVNKTNIRLYPLSSYTKELCEMHGFYKAGGDFTLTALKEKIKNCYGF